MLHEHLILSHVKSMQDSHNIHPWIPLQTIPVLQNHICSVDFDDKKITC